MKITTRAVLASFLFAAGGFNWASALDFVAVAERPAVAALKDSAPARPVSFVAYDGGFIEAGNPVAGETPPSSVLVAQTLLNAVRSQGLAPATAGVEPSLVLIYHWGVIGPGYRRGLLAGADLESNFKARLYLSTTDRIGHDIEEQILSRTSPLGYRPNWQDAISRAQDRRYFVIVSAYDFGSFVNAEKKLIWRVKLSAEDRAGEMSEVIPALIQGGASYFGRNLDRPETGRVEMVKAGGPENTNGTAFSIPLEVSRRINPDFLHSVMKQEYFEFSGELFRGK